MAQNLELFFAKNKAKTENQFYPATKSLCGADGKPLMWEIRKIPIDECEAIRKDCTFNKQIPGKRGLTQTVFDSERYTKMIVCAAVVYPPLDNAGLQDSYGVKTPEDLILKMIDDLGEWTDLQNTVYELNGITESMDDKVEEAKN